MSEPYDRSELAPPGEAGTRRAPYAALAVTGLVVSTVFATVAALASGHGNEAGPQAPLDPGPVLVSTEVETSTETVDPTSAEVPPADPTSTTSTTPGTTTKKRPTTTRPTATTPTPTPEPTQPSPTPTPTPSPTSPTPTPTTTTPPPTTTTPPH